MSILVYKSLHSLQIASLGPKGCILFKKVFDVYYHISWGGSFSLILKDGKTNKTKLKISGLV